MFWVADLQNQQAAAIAAAGRRALEVDRYVLRSRQKTESLDSILGRKDYGFIEVEADG